MKRPTSVELVDSNSRGNDSGDMIGKFSCAGISVNILEETTILVRAIEAHQTKRNWSQWRAFAYLQRRLGLVPAFLKTGMDAKIEDAFIVWGVGSVVIFVASRLALPPGISTGLIGNVLALVGTVLVLGPVAFALPSIYGQSGVKPSDLIPVTNQLASRGFATIQSVDLLWKSTKLLEDRVRARVAATKWGVGVLWASAIYILGKAVDVSESAAKDPRLFMLATMSLVCCALTYSLVWSYEAAIDRLFRTIEFGCNDYCVTLERHASIAM
jgi:hypothetical protein